ncbi:hypothetical protein FACS1894126_4020 [Alphaproteobacteria bacterium]|nr:hypothetical protein FACS1894126_4020 [Alphaproteobacteria bacterium]
MRDSQGVLDIIRIKRLMQNTEKAEDFRYIFNERAAILEFDAGYERKEAKMVNGHISEFLKALGINDCLNELQLLKVGDLVLELLRERFLKLIEGNFYNLNCLMQGVPCHALFYQILCSGNKEKFDKFKGDILCFLNEELKTMEDDSLRGTCRIYRGDRQSEVSNDKFVEGEGMYEAVGKAAISFSNGWFGGVVNDSDTGMAYNFYLRGKANKYQRFFWADVNKRNMGAVFIPWISIFGAAVGFGELHHPRIKMLAPCEKVPGMQGNAGMPDDSKSMHELVCDNEADFSQFKVTEITDKGSADFIVKVKK